MNKFILVIFAFVSVATARVIYSDGYYWRDYDGEIPVDAYVAGFDFGKPIYIGQVLIGEKIIPGRIYADDNKIYYEWRERAWAASNNIKILCTRRPENMKWVPTTITDRSEFEGERVVGGYQPGFHTYIGRIYSDQERNIGKVICYFPTPCLALYTVKNKNNNVEYHKFEILTYKFDDFDDTFKNQYSVLTTY